MSERMQYLIKINDIHNNLMVINKTRSSYKYVIRKKYFVPEYRRVLFYDIL